MTETSVENGGLGDISLSRCEIQFLMNVTDVEDLGEALDVAAINLGRYGMDSFFVVATDPDTGRSWVLHQGEVSTQEQLAETHEALRNVLDEGGDGDGLDADNQTGMDLSADGDQAQ